MQTFLNILMIVLAMVIATCLVSTMALFMGGGQTGTDLYALMLLQWGSVPVALLAIVVALLFGPHHSAGPLSFKRLYAAVPQWMALAFFLLFLLVASGEIALLIVARLADTPPAWTAHAPLVSMLFCSLAISVL